MIKSSWHSRLRLSRVLLFVLWCIETSCFGFQVQHAAKVGLATLQAKAEPTQELRNKDNAKNIKPTPPPWKFQASKVYYQLRWIPTDKAQKYTPGCHADTNIPWSLKVLSVPFQDGSYTLGGIFVIEYTDSPIGPYREVACLSSLVLALPRNIFRNFPRMGAWASHILVDSEEAATYGAQYWGLPATVMHNLDFYSDPDVNETKSIQFDGDRVVVAGWDSSSPSDRIDFNWDWLDVALPSLSGLLPQPTATSTAMERTLLLEYPLRLMAPSSIGLVPNGPISFSNKSTQTASSSQVVDEMHDLLQDSKIVFSIGIDNVALEAGEKQELQ